MSQQAPGLRRMIARDWRESRGMGAVQPMLIPGHSPAGRVAAAHMSNPNASPAMRAMAAEFMARNGGLSGVGCCGNSGMGDIIDMGNGTALDTSTGQIVATGIISNPAAFALQQQAAASDPNFGTGAFSAEGSSGGSSIGSFFSSLFGAAPQLATTGINAYRQFTGTAVAPPVVTPGLSGGAIAAILSLAAIGGIAIAMSSKGSSPAPKSNPRRFRLRTYRRRRGSR